MEWIPCSISVIKSEFFPLHLSRNQQVSSSVAKDYKEALKIVQGVKKRSRGQAKARAPRGTNDARPATTDPGPSGSNVETVMQDDGDETIEPFFPAAFAVSSERPTEYNFNLCLYDTPCRLQLELRPDFKAVHKCRTLSNAGAVEAMYSKWFSLYSNRLRLQGTHDDSEATASAARKRLDKMEIFLRSGRPMDEMLKFGKPPADDRLWAVRLDMMGNVMVYGAPEWSDCAVQFTHGFPRKLIRAGHGGYTNGNITCTSRMTNEMIRSTANGDILAFCRKSNLKGCGLHPAVVYHCRKAEFSIKDKSLPSSARVMESTFR